MSLKNKMKELKLSFVEKLPEYLDKVQTGYKRLCENPQDETKDVLQGIFLQLHSVKGAAATFGLTRVSETSKLAEKEASHLIDLYKKEGSEESFLTAVSSFQKSIFDLAEVIRDVQVDQEDNTLESSFDLSSLETEEAEYPVEQKLIFICDDDPESVEHLRLQLKYLGYNVVPFIDTDTLLEAAITRHPAAIVMDITFPKGQRSGPEVVSHLRSKLDRLPPIVFISSRSDYQARYEAVLAGGDAYYVKPLKTLELVHTLDELTIAVKHEPNKVLIVDDEPEVAKFHSAILNEAKMQTYELYSPENILEVLDTFKPDLVLMDMHMPTYSGREVAKVIRQIPEYLSLPIIYLSSEMDEVKQANALRAGAEGFLTKPISPVTLINEVNVRVQRMQDLRSLMVKDSLTGLFNHTFIQRFLDATFANAVRTKQPCCVVMIDIDH
ncbi:MAG: response regulator, partial [Methylocystaceae bacterium]|nr:response regulator [Methylocystaceae bacterium]